MFDTTYRDNYRGYTHGPHCFQLRTVNTGGFPLKPNHPHLTSSYSSSNPPPILNDGTRGDLDWLHSSYTYLPDRPWVHYIPTRNMWKDGLSGYRVVPIFVKPDEHNGIFWKKGFGPAGHFTGTLIDDLRRFYDEGLAQALRLLPQTADYCHIPHHAPSSHWSNLRDTGIFPSMMKILVETQRRVAELYGWIFLQEKLQPNIPSIRPRPSLGVNLATGVMATDHFLGVIVPWDSHSERFEKVAMDHGVPLWWCDYSRTPGAPPPWIGLPRADQAAVDLHRGTGYAPLGDGDCRLMFSITTDSTMSALDAIVSRHRLDPSRYKSWVTSEPSIVTATSTSTRSPIVIPSSSHASSLPLSSSSLVSPSVTAQTSHKRSGPEESRGHGSFRKIPRLGSLGHVNELRIRANFARIWILKPLNS